MTTPDLPPTPPEQPSIVQRYLSQDTAPYEEVVKEIVDPSPNMVLGAGAVGVTAAHIRGKEQSDDDHVQHKKKRK